MQRLFFAAILTAILGFSVRAEANLNCNVGVSTHLGDSISGQITIYRSGSGGGYTFGVFSSTGKAVTWSPFNQTQTGNVDTFTFSFVADTAGELFYAQSTGTSDSCSLSAWVTGNPRKDSQNHYANLAEMAAITAAGIALKACPTLLPQTCVGAGIAGIVAGVVTFALSKPDPWDPNYATEYEGMPWPNAQDYGLYWTGVDWQDQMTSDALGLIWASDYVYVSLNRSSSCDMAGADCAAARASEAMWGLWVMRYYLAHGDASSGYGGLSWDHWILAYVMGTEGADPSDIQAVQDYAQSLSDAGEALTQ